MSFEGSALKSYQQLMRKKGSGERFALSFGILFAIFLAVSFVQIRAPYSFPLETVITIPEGATLFEVTELLHDEKVVRSKFVFRLLIVLISNDSNILAGDYYFHDKKNAYRIAKMVTMGDFGLTPIRVTIPEGSTLAEMTEIYLQHFDQFQPDDFFDLTQGKEGYLFPDTYFFDEEEQLNEIVERMLSNFDDKVDEPLRIKIKADGRNLYDVVILASLLEREVQTEEDMRVVSGILWKRMEIGMPLQVDATLVHITGKNGSNLTSDDKLIDSPYNTYKYRGLPPTPINNPGLKSIEAGAKPIETEFLYYLTCPDGETLYAKTLDEHNSNKACLR